jgi:putative ABC transport system ATP-binding protein
LGDDQRETIKISGLNHHYGSGDVRSQVLDDIELTIRPSELVILIGPSGCGKTTLLTLIGGLRKVQEGSLRVLGREMAGMQNAQLVKLRREIGFIFQAHNLFESLTAAQNVRMAMQLRRSDSAGMREDAAKALEAVGLKERIHYKPRSLSGGQRQRVAIARALVNRPRLVLADEPTAALDKNSTEQVMDLIDELKRDGSTILVVTHDNKIMSRADRIISMADKQIKSNATRETFRICEFLKDCPVFEKFETEKLASIAGKVRLEHFPAMARIIRQGDAGDKFYIINRGKADVYVNDGLVDRRVAVLAKGDYFGEIALLEDRPRNATVQAIEDIEAYTLDKGEFLEAINSTESFEQRLRSIFSGRQ